jgi:hypothetical protein
MPRFTPVPASRLARRYRQRIHAAPSRVFELLCPEREKDWLAGWNYTMLHSVSGLAEPGAVFATPGAPGAAHDVVWVTVAHVPPTHVRFVRWHPDEMVVDIDIHVSGTGDGESSVDIAYTYTAVSAAGARRIAAMDETQWLAQMHTWEDSMNAWFARTDHE